MDNMGQWRVAARQSPNYIVDIIDGISVRNVFGPVGEFVAAAFLRVGAVASPSRVRDGHQRGQGRQRKEDSSMHRNDSWWEWNGHDERAGLVVFVSNRWTSW